MRNQRVSQEERILARLEAMERQFRQSSNHFSGLESDEENLSRQAAFESCADELLSLVADVRGSRE
jgi:hypothetical protein